MSEISRSPLQDPNRRGSWAVHAACYALLGGIFLYVVVARYLYPLVISESIGVETSHSDVLPTQAHDVEQRIDPNVADWPELTRLPGVGEAIAKRIVEYRKAQSPDGARLVFQSPQDLEAVSGIGPRKVELMEPFLKFSTTSPGP